MLGGHSKGQGTHDAATHADTVRASQQAEDEGRRQRRQAHVGVIHLRGTFGATRRITGGADGEGRRRRTVR